MTRLVDPRGYSTGGRSKRGSMIEFGKAQSRSWPGQSAAGTKDGGSRRVQAARAGKWGSAMDEKGGRHRP